MDSEIHPTRTTWAMFVINLATNIGICYVLVRLFKDTYDWTDVMWVFLAIVVVDIAVWLRNTLARSLAFRLVGKDFIRRVNLNILSSNEMPKPDEFSLEPEEYFNEIIADEDSTRAHTIIASYALGQIQYPVQTSRVLESLRLRSGVRLALAEYGGHSLD